MWLINGARPTSTRHSGTNECCLFDEYSHHDAGVVLRRFTQIESLKPKPIPQQVKRCNTPPKIRPSVLEHCWSSTYRATIDANGDETNRKPLTTNVVIIRTDCRTAIQKQSDSVQSPEYSITERTYKKRPKKSTDDDLLIAERKYLQQYCVSPKNQRHSPRVIAKKSKIPKHPIKSVRLSVLKKGTSGKNSPSPKFEQRRRFICPQWDKSVQEYRTEKYPYRRSDQVMFESDAPSDPSSDPIIIYSPKSFMVTPNIHEHEPKFGSKDITYGPGIVQKLRAKFAQMSDAATQNVRISPYTKRKRFPSADDILSDEPRQGDQTPYRPENYLLKNSANRSISQASIAVSSNEKVEKTVLGELSKEFVERESMQQRCDTIYNEGQSLPAHLAGDSITHEDSPTRVPISSLREKFELISQQSLSARKSTVAALISRRISRSRSAAPNTDDSGEPEFIRVQRTLRRSQSRDEVHADTTPSDGSYRNRFLKPSFLAIKKESKMIDSCSIPQFKKSARIISPTKDQSSIPSGPPLPVRVSALISPPDPETARLMLSEPTPSPHYEPAEPSPPPDEPKPISIDINEVENRNNEFQRNATEKIVSPNTPSSLLSPPLLSPDSLITSPQLDDRSGLDEMHRLLSKFGINRENDSTDDEVNNETTKTSLGADRSLKEERIEANIGEAANLNFTKAGIERPAAKAFFGSDDLPKRSPLEPLNRPTSMLRNKMKIFDSDHVGSTDRLIQARILSPLNLDTLPLVSPRAQIGPLSKANTYVPSNQPNNQPTNQHTTNRQLHNDRSAPVPLRIVNIHPCYHISQQSVIRSPA